MKRRFSRTFLMITGIITVAVILLSQSFYRPASLLSDRSKKEQKAKPSEQTDKHVSVAPSEVVQSTSVQVDKNTPDLLEILAPEEQTETVVVSFSEIFIPLFKSLLRATISPNAP